MGVKRYLITFKLAILFEGLLMSRVLYLSALFFVALLEIPKLIIFLFHTVSRCQHICRRLYTFTVKTGHVAEPLFPPYTTSLSCFAARLYGVSKYSPNTSAVTEVAAPDMHEFFNLSPNKFPTCKDSLRLAFLLFTFKRDYLVQMFSQRS